MEKMPTFEKWKSEGYDYHYKERIDQNVDFLRTIRYLESLKVSRAYYAVVSDDFSIRDELVSESLLTRRIDPHLLEVWYEDITEVIKQRLQEWTSGKKYKIYF